MTMEEVIENELKCVQRDCCRLENECAKCDLVLPIEEIINAYNEALRLKKENLYYKDIIETNSAEWEEQGRRIVILEKEIAELKYQLNKNPCVKIPEWHCSDCLKEIAELKEQNTNLQEMLKTERSVTCKEEYLKKVTELEQENAELKEKLIKAKEIIADFESRVHYRKVYIGNITELMSRAERLLMELHI